MPPSSSSPVGLFHALTQWRCSDDGQRGPVSPHDPLLGPNLHVQRQTDAVGTLSCTTTAGRMPLEKSHRAWTNTGTFVLQSQMRCVLRCMENACCVRHWDRTRSGPSPTLYIALLGSGVEDASARSLLDAGSGGRGLMGKNTRTTRADGAGRVRRVPRLGCGAKKRPGGSRSPIVDQSMWPWPGAGKTPKQQQAPDPANRERGSPPMAARRVL